MAEIEMAVPARDEGGWKGCYGYALPTAWGLAGLGLMLLLKNRVWRKTEGIHFLVVAAGLGINLVLIPVPHRQYLLPLLPFVGGLGAYALATLPRWAGRASSRSCPEGASRRCRGTPCPSRS